MNEELEQIVQSMIEAGESESNIAIVIENYDVKKKEQSVQDSKTSIPDSGEPAKVSLSDGEVKSEVKEESFSPNWGSKTGGFTDKEKKSMELSVEEQADLEEADALAKRQSEIIKGNLRENFASVLKEDDAEYKKNLRASIMRETGNSMVADEADAYIDKLKKDKALLDTEVVDPIVNQDQQMVFDNLNKMQSVQPTEDTKVLIPGEGWRNKTRKEVKDEENVLFTSDSKIYKDYNNYLATTDPDKAKSSAEGEYSDGGEKAFGFFNEALNHQTKLNDVKLENGIIDEATWENSQRGLADKFKTSLVKFPEYQKEVTDSYVAQAKVDANYDWAEKKITEGSALEKVQAAYILGNQNIIIPAMASFTKMGASIVSTAGRVAAANPLLPDEAGRHINDLVDDMDLYFNTEKASSIYKKPTQLQGQLFEDGEFQGRLLLPKLAEAGANMYGLIGGGGALSAEMGIAGVGAKYAPNLGLVAMSVMTTQNDYYKAGREQGMNHDDAMAYSLAISVPVGLVQTISPQKGLAKSLGFVEAGTIEAKDFTKQVFKKMVSDPKLWKKAVASGLSISKEGLKEIAQEEVEGVAENAGNYAFNNMVGTNFKTSTSLDEHKEMWTIAGILGAGGQVKSSFSTFNNVRSESFYSAMKNNADFTKMIENNSLKNQFGEENIKQAQADLKAYTEQFDLLPDTYSEGQKMMLATLGIDIQRKKQERNKKATLDERINKSELEELDKDISVLEDQYDELLGNDAEVVEETDSEEVVKPIRDKDWDVKTKESLAESKVESKEEFEKDLKEGVWGMLTAENPDAKAQSEEANKASNEKARGWLKERGYDTSDIFGKYGNSENSFFVKGLTKEDAIDFAKEFNQESVATNEGLIYQDGSMNPRIEGGESFETGDDFYSTINIKGDKQNFSIEYDFDQTIKNKEVLKEKSTDKEVVKEEDDSWLEDNGGSKTQLNAAANLMEEYKGESFPKKAVAKAILNDDFNEVVKTDWYKNLSNTEKYAFEYNFKKSTGKDVSKMDKPKTVKQVKDSRRQVKAELKARKNSENYKKNTDKEIAKSLEVLNKIKEEDLSKKQKAEKASLEMEIERRNSEETPIMKKSDDFLNAKLKEYDATEKAIKDSNPFVKKKKRTELKQRIKDIKAATKEAIIKTKEEVKLFQKDVKQYAEVVLKEHNISPAKQKQLINAIIKANSVNSILRAFETVDKIEKAGIEITRKKTILEIKKLVGSKKTVEKKRSGKWVGKVTPEVARFISEYDLSNLDNATNQEAKDILSILNSMVNNSAEDVKAKERIVKAQKRRLSGNVFSALYSKGEVETVSGREDVVAALKDKTKAVIIDGQLISSEFTLKEAEKERADSWNEAKKVRSKASKEAETLLNEGGTEKEAKAIIEKAEEEAKKIQRKGEAEALLIESESDQEGSLEDFEDYEEANPGLNYDNVKVYTLDTKKNAVKNREQNWRQRFSDIRKKTLLFSEYVTANLELNMMPLIKNSKTMREFVDNVVRKISESEYNYAKEVSELTKNHNERKFEAMSKANPSLAPFGLKVAKSTIVNKRLASKSDVIVYKGLKAAQSNNSMIDWYLMYQTEVGKKKMEDDSQFDTEALLEYMNKPENADLLAVADLFINEIYPELKKRYEPNYFKLTGKKFDEGTFYPLYTDHMKSNDLTLEGLDSKGADLNASKPFAKSMQSRVDNNSALNYTLGVSEKLDDYISSMERVKQFDEVSDLIGATFNKNTIPEMINKIGLTQYEAIADHLAGSITGIDPRTGKNNVGKGINNALTSFAVLVSLPFKPMSVIAQSASALHFSAADNMTLKEFATGYAKMLKPSNAKALKEFATSTYVKNRLSGASKDINIKRILRKNSKGNIVSGIGKGMVQTGMGFISVGDILGVLGGGMPMMVSRFEHYRNMGFDIDTATDKAVMDVAIESESAQQSSIYSQTSHFQRNEFARMFTMYKSSQISAMNKLLVGYKKIRSNSELSSKEKAAQTYKMMYFTASSTLFSAIKHGGTTALAGSMYAFIKGLVDDDESDEYLVKGDYSNADRKRLVHDIALDVTQAKLDAMGVSGYVANVAMNTLRGREYFNELPISAAVQKFVTSVWSATEFLANNEKWEDMTKQEQDAKTKEMIDGTPFKNINKLIESIEKHNDDQKTLYEGIVNLENRKEWDKKEPNLTEDALWMMYNDDPYFYNKLLPHAQEKDRVSRYKKDLKDGLHLEEHYFNKDFRSK